MTEIPFPVDDLNDDGASFMLEKLYGLPENCISSWASMGPALERNKVSVQYSDSAEWEAYVESGEYAVASNPRLAVALTLIKKLLLKTPIIHLRCSSRLKQHFPLA
jgi:hypothetical protein